MLPPPIGFPTPDLATMTDSTDQSSSSASPEAVDSKAIDAVLRIGGVALLERLVEVAEGNVRERFRQLEVALGSTPPDPAAAERAAHSVKSSAAYLGAEALRRHAEDMERDAGEGRLDDLPEKLVEARRLLELVLPALREEVVRRSMDST